MALLATGMHPVSLDEGLCSPVGSSSQGESPTRTGPFPAPSTLLSLLPSPLQPKAPVLGEPWEGHGHKPDPRATVPSQKRASSSLSQLLPGLGLVSVLPSLMHLLHSNLDHRFLREKRGGLHCYTDQSSGYLGSEDK